MKLRCSDPALWISVVTVVISHLSLISAQVAETAAVYYTVKFAKCMSCKESGQAITGTSLNMDGERFAKILSSGEAKGKTRISSDTILRDSTSCILPTINPLHVLSSCDKERSRQVMQELSKFVKQKFPMAEADILEASTLSDFTQKLHAPHTTGGNSGALGDVGPFISTGTAFVKGPAQSSINSVFNVLNGNQHSTGTLNTGGHVNTNVQNVHVNTGTSQSSKEVLGGQSGMQLSASKGSVAASLKTNNHQSGTLELLDSASSVGSSTHSLRGSYRIQPVNTKVHVTGSKEIKRRSSHDISSNSVVAQGKGINHALGQLKSHQFVGPQSTTNVKTVNGLVTKEELHNNGFQSHDTSFQQIHNSNIHTKQDVQSRQVFQTKGAHQLSASGSDIGLGFQMSKSNLATGYHVPEHSKNRLIIRDEYSSYPEHETVVVHSGSASASKEDSSLRLPFLSEGKESGSNILSQITGTAQQTVKGIIGKSFPFL